MYDDRKTEETDASWKKITYASTGDMYKVNYNYIASKDPEILKSGQKKELKSDISLAAYRSTKSKPTRERIANYIKSVIHARSKWKQVYSSGVPLIDGQGNAAGIGGVPLSSEATSLNVAKRLLWDWKYNLEYAIGQLFDAYEAALEKKNIKWKSRPWEWMVTAYSTGTIETDLESQFLAQVHSIFETYYNGVDRLYGSPTTTMNIKILQQREQLDSHQMGILQGNKDDIIEDLLATGYRKDKKSKKETKEWLEDQSSQKVQSIYEDWMKDLMKRDTTEDKPTWYQVRFGRNQADINNNEANRDDYSEQWENYKKYSAASDYIDNNENNRLVNQKDPQEVFPDMFTDMIEYDQRMRLVRAFPAFQMFIVDEGRWMTNYRLWDNLYGFNAIQSIDVHKSRKIAADTAVIQMTNIYSNLTSRSLDQSYEDWDVKFWDNLVFGNPNEEILAARKELLNAMFLQTGARIHLRMGYGSSVVDLPVMFNGTITELNAEETVTIVAQGDGIELGNVISGDPNDNNKGLFKITEPRDLICELLTSKGNWFYDAINAATEGELFRDNPLGILHFGQPGSKVPEGTWKFFNENYGEAAQNIYSSNGIPTFSQYAYADGSDIPWSWDTPVTKWLQPGDEENIVVPFYNNTVWDITQTIAYCTPDYMAAVHPFEMRSTLFFGKPYWYMAYKYDSRYEYNAKDKNWIRYRDLEHRKPYSQVNMFFSQTDIISNKIKASEEGVYTNVIVNYDGKQSPLVYADFDIRLDKQKTTVLDAQIVSRMPGLDFWTSEKQAMFYAMSAVRDYMKDMYKGQLVVMGDPTIKPHNIAYMTDVMNDMHGNFLVKAVTHHFSLETGFISSVEPDAFVVNDDMAWLNMSNWVWTLGAKMASAYIGYAYVSKVLRRLVPSSLGTKAMKAASKGGTITTQYAVSKLADLLPDDDEDIVKFKKLAKELERMKAGDPERAAKIKKMQEAGEKVQKKLKQMKKDGSFVNSAGKKIKGKGSYARLSRTVFAMRQGANALSDGKKALNLIKGAGTALGLLNPLAVVASILTSWATETIAEKYRRKKATMQAVMMMPLQYQGKQYTAGINGHKGMVIGDSPGKLDSFLSGAGLDGKDGEGGFLDFEWAMDTWNWLTNAEGKDYAISEEDLQNGNYNNNN
ncbi:hypothetical protein QO179_24670 [Bacillus stercoris]|nr:hypothetical protein [Bacillus stercoris]